MLYVFRLWLRDLAHKSQKPARSRRSLRPTRRALAPLALESLEPLIMPVLNTGYGQLPIAFETNQGQADSQVQFLARGPGYGLFLTPTDAVLTFNSAATSLDVGADPAPVPQPTVLRITLSGASLAAQGTAQNPLGGVSNYLIGADPSGWITGVEQFGR